MYAARSRLGWLRWLHGWLLATTSAGVTTRPSNSLHNTITSALRGIARLIRPISAMIAARSNIFSTQKKTQGKISVGGPRAEARDRCGAPPPPSLGDEHATQACSGEMPRTMPVTWARRLSTCEAGIGCGFETGIGTATDPGRANLLLADPSG